MLNAVRCSQLRNIKLVINLSNVTFVFEDANLRDQRAEIFWGFTRFREVQFKRYRVSLPFVRCDLPLHSILSIRLLRRLLLCKHTRHGGEYGEYCRYLRSLQAVTTAVNVRRPMPGYFVTQWADTIGT